MRTAHSLRDDGDIRLCAGLGAAAVKGKWLGIAAVLLTLGGLTAGGQVSAESATQEQVRFFGGFYHDSIDAFFEVVGEGLLSMPMEQFEALPNERQRQACSVIVDHTTYRSVMVRGFHAAHGKQNTIEFMQRAKEAGGFLFKDIKAKFEMISQKSVHCAHNGMVWVAAKHGIPFNDYYADTPTEFALRDLYESQVPFVRWTWKSVPVGEEWEDMKVLIRNMERKYLLEIAER